MNKLNNIEACKEAIKALRAFPKTCWLKSQHKLRLYQLRALMDEYCVPLNSVLFGQYNYDTLNYKRAVHNYREVTKTSLDNLLGYSIESLINTIQSLIKIQEKLLTR